MCTSLKIVLTVVWRGTGDVHDYKRFDFAEPWHHCSHAEAWACACSSQVLMCKLVLSRPSRVCELGRNLRVRREFSRVCE